MSVILGKRVLSTAIVSVLSLSVSQISSAASDVDISLDLTVNMDNLTAGIRESNADGANLNIGVISSIWDSEFAPYATISTGDTIAGAELGAINFNAALDFNGYTETLILNSHDVININANIFDSNTTTDDRLMFVLQPGGNSGSQLDVNLNATIGEGMNTEITGAGSLVIGATGAYNLVNAADSLTVGSITNNADGAFNYTAGSLTITNTDYVLNIDNAGLLGGSVTLNSSQNLQTAGQVISAGSALTQSGGTNTIAGSYALEGLVIESGGNYNLSGGALVTNSINVSGDLLQTGGSVTVDDANGGSSSVNNRLWVNTGGSYTLGGGTLDAYNVVSEGVVTQNGGAVTTSNAVSVHAGGSYILNSGTVDTDHVTILGSGDLTQNGGTITITNDFSTSSGGSYTLNSGTMSADSITNNGDINLTGAMSIDVSGVSAQGGAITANSISNDGNLNVGSLQVEDNAIFTGIGTVNATGDITDLRATGIIDASYNGANVSLMADTMNGAIDASESISLDSITVNGVITGTAMTLSGGSDLTNDVNLKPYVLNTFYNNSVITSAGGDNTISGNINIAPLVVDRFLSTEIVDGASIDVDAGSLAITGDVNSSLMDMSLNVSSGSSLSLQGNSTSAKSLYANVATGGSLLLGNTSATNFYASGVGSFEVNGALTALGNVTIQSGDLSVTGSVEANGAAIVVGTNTVSSNTATLNIDNSASAMSARIGDTTDIQLSTGSTLTLTGHATGSVAEKAGSLIVNHLNTSYTSSRDFVSNVVVNGGTGTTQLTFDDLQLASPAGSEVNRIDFATNGSFGGNEKILFNAAPTLVDGLLSNATINAQEFVTYDNSLGVKSATTATNSFVGAGNILINSDTNHAASATINSLAVTTANVTGAGDITISSGQMLLSGTSTISPAIHFGAKEGYAVVTGNSTLAGGVSGTNGMFVNGGGVLTLASTGTVAGAVIVNSGGLVLSANDALQSSDITNHDNLDIGVTTQHVNSLTTGSGFSGTGTVIAANDISYTSNVGTVDTNYQSLTSNVAVYADVMNGDVNALYGSTDNLKGIVTLGSTASGGYITMNGNTTASRINAYGTINGDMDASNSVYLSGTSNGSISGAAINVYGTINGDMDASNSVYLSGTSNGSISGAAGLSGYGTLTASNSYTGLTSGNFTLTGNGSIANSSGFSNGSLSMYTNDGEANINRIGDEAVINLAGSYRSLNLIGSGTELAGVAISEDAGIIDVGVGNEVSINIDNSLNGSTLLTANGLALGNDSLVFLSLGDSSQLKFDAAPASIGSTGIIDGVYVEKVINGAVMPTWTTYDGGISGAGVVEVVVAASSIAGASAGDFIRVTDATNVALNSAKSIGAMTVDTTQIMSGSGPLTINSGQIQFWQDNTIDIAQIDFGAEQGFLSNAGINTINSVLTGTGGLRKLGDGKVILGGANTYTGNTLISGGEIEVTGSLVSGVNVSNGASLVINGGQVNRILSNAGSTSLINTSYSTNAGQNLLGYGSFSLDNSSSLTNAGSMGQHVYNNGGTVSNSSTGYIDTVSNASGSNLSSYGDIHIVYNSSGASFTHSAGEVDYLSNSGVYNGTVNSVIGSVSNASSFTSKGVIKNDITNSGTFINDHNVSLDGTSIYTYSDELTNNSGATFTNNADISVSQQGYMSIDGTFVNNGNVVMQSTDNAQSISGSLTNNVGATVDVNGSVVNLDGAFTNKGSVNVNGSVVNLDGAFTNKGSVNVDATSLVTGSGTYTQQGDKDATTVVNGRVETDVIINNGVLSGIGQIAGDLTVTAPGILRPGQSPGLMTIEGDLNLSGYLDLEVVLNTETGLLEYDSLAIGGIFNIFGNGKINFDLGVDVSESIFTGENPLLDLTDIFYGINEASDPLDLTSLLATTLRLDLASGESFKLSLAEDELGGYSASVAAVPVPAAVWLFGSGLLGLIGMARRKKA